MSLELDHVMVFVPDPDAIEPGWFPGCRFEPGQRHTGQGTRNRRVVFPRTFIELVWIDDGEEHERTVCVPRTLSRHATADTRVRDRRGDLVVAVERSLRKAGECGL